MRLPGLRSFREDIFGLEEAHVAFYVGVELTAKDGADLGMLCAPAAHRAASEQAASANMSKARGPPPALDEHPSTLSVHHLIPAQSA